MCSTRDGETLCVQHADCVWDSIMDEVHVSVGGQGPTAQGCARGRGGCLCFGVNKYKQIHVNTHGTKYQSRYRTHAV